ncbi:hypothetical protein FRB94_012749 [Tulasnella sp. JGI-2019a]|nr:hypothetical protein FRB94_012749 [Tulasnella sp. JGI-2019a]
MTGTQADTKSLKRPRGLFKSKKGGKNTESNPGPSAKRRKQAQEDLGEPGAEDLTAEGSGKSVTYEDWEDLKEIFANALHNYKGPEPTTCAPLLRGVIHECDRFIRNLDDPTSVYRTNLEVSSSVSRPTTDSLLSFATIQGYALYLMGTLILDDPAIVTEGEPTDPAEYFEVVLSTFDDAFKRYKGEGPADILDPWRARMEIVWGDAINGLAATRNESGPSIAEDDHAMTLYKAETAVAHFLDAQRCFPSTKRVGSSDPVLSVDSEVDPTSIVTLTRNAMILETGRGIIEASYREDDGDLVREWCNRVVQLVDSSSFTDADDRETRASFDILRGKCWLTTGALLSEACAGADDYPESLGTSEAHSARDELEKAIKFLVAARKHLEDLPDYESLDTHQNAEQSLGEAYMHLGNVTVDEGKRESLYTLAKGLGVDVDLLGGSSDDGDEDNEGVEEEEEWKGLEGSL